MIKTLKRIGLLSLIAMFLSCSNDKVVYDESMIIANSSWNNQDLPYFDVNIEDTLTAYNFYLNLRHLENYKYSNFYMFLHTTFPNGAKTHDTIELVLAYPDGRWTGKGSGSMRSNQILLNNDLHFPLKGEYRFEIEQAMREQVLNGITDIGLRFEKRYTE